MLSFLCVAASAQSAASEPSEGAEHITLGQSVFALNGPWKFSIGDSPLDPATHKPLWAEPDFDDSRWETVDLTPQEGSFDPLAGISGYVPGWTAKGHPGYSGYAWYRIRVRLDGFVGAGLAFSGPDNVDDGYQVFDNGELLGSFGDFSGRQPVVYASQQTVFTLPAAARKDEEVATHVIACRMWMETNTAMFLRGTGGFHAAPLFGRADSVAAQYQLSWFHAIRADALEPVEAFLFLLLAVLAVGIQILDRSDRVHFWIAAVFLLSAISSVVDVISVWSQVLSQPMYQLLARVILGPLVLGLWVMVWWVWFRLERHSWLPGMTIGLTLLYMLTNLLGQEIIVGLVPHRVASGFYAFTITVRLAFVATLLLMAALGIRERKSEGWITLPAVLLLGISKFKPELYLIHVRVSGSLFGTRVGISDAASLLLVLALFLLLLRRMFVSLRLQREQALDIKQAAEVQQVILPESRTAYPGLVIETEYRAARQVGGDFFQVIQHPTDGSVLIVAGDVTGKGLQAGMTVALLIGAIRGTAELNPDPLFLIQALNRRLIGRDSAQATCLALRIAADGSCTLANAGHVPPYLNGKPLEMEGALPLGMIEGAEFSVMRLQLNPADKLVMVSDGILEAANEKGQLFGFDRVEEFLASNAAVKALADAAQLFGQNDDISLVAVTRTA